MTAIASTEDKVTAPPSPRIVVSALGIAQILAWGSSYYLPAVLAAPIAVAARFLGRSAPQPNFTTACRLAGRCGRSRATARQRRYLVQDTFRLPAAKWSCTRGRVVRCLTMPSLGGRAGGLCSIPQMPSMPPAVLFDARFA
jgi:hypothetical protein